MSKADQIRKYKGIIVPKAQQLFAKDCEFLTIEQTDSRLKYESGYEYSSVKVMDAPQLRELIQNSIEYIHQRWGVDLSQDPLDKDIDLNFDRQ